MWHEDGTDVARLRAHVPVASCQDARLALVVTSDRDVRFRRAGLVWCAALGCGQDQQLGFFPRRRSRWLCDELTDPFAAVVYLRREHYPVPSLREASGRGHARSRQEQEGGAPVGNTDFHDRVLGLLDPALVSVCVPKMSSGLVASMC
jgi:hypothetical protein